MISIRQALLCAIIAAFLLIACPRSLRAKHIPDSLAETLTEISGLIYNDAFPEAKRVIDSLSNSETNRSFVFLSYSILYQSMMMASESDSLKNELYASLDSVKSYAEGMLEHGHDSALAYYFLGHQYAFRSLYEGRAGHTWSAIKKGLKARNAYSKAYKIDSTFYDIGLGLGSYRYWKSIKTKALNWTPLFKNEKKNGISLLRLAADSSEISQEAARAALIWVYINEERYGEAILLADEMNHRYPQGLTFLWALGETYYRLGDCPKAVEIYEQILTRLEQAPGNYYNIIEASYFLVNCFKKLSVNRPAYKQKICALKERILSMPIPEKTKKRQKKRLKTIINGCKTK